MDQKVLQDELLALVDEKYRKFSSSLTPGTDNILGVRLPALRKIGKKIAKADWRSYLETARDDSFEETLLQGMVIGYADMELTERLVMIKTYLPKIDNWSICDSFCTGLKFT
ncbi:MAG: DNA alkylation repair protein, partial [Firmicutes bacterium HGW-Firmicutes-6]